MSMSIFAETIAAAIKEYRFYLRKTMKQADRMAKLAELKLKDVNIYSGDVVLYQTAQAIVADIQHNISIPEQGYYSYSGIEKFCEYLSTYIKDYAIENDKVIHRAQRASRAIMEAIQIVNGKPAHTLSDRIKRNIHACQEKIVFYGNQEQFDLYTKNLEKLKPNAPLFFTDLLRHFNMLLQKLREAA